jgi:hypothetical protein
MLDKPSGDAPAAGVLASLKTRLGTTGNTDESSHFGSLEFSNKRSSSGSVSLEGTLRSQDVVGDPDQSCVGLAPCTTSRISGTLHPIITARHAVESCSVNAAATPSMCPAPHKNNPHAGLAMDATRSNSDKPHGHLGKKSNAMAVGPLNDYNSDAAGTGARGAEAGTANQDHSYAIHSPPVAAGLAAEGCTPIVAGLGESSPPDAASQESPELPNAPDKTGSFVSTALVRLDFSGALVWL